MDTVRSRQRSTNAQLRFLVDFMALNPTFANGGIDGSIGIMEQQEKWETLATLLAKHGPNKTVDQWKTSWRDLKKNARLNKKKLFDASASKEEVSEHMKLHLKILSIIGDEDDYEKRGPNSSTASLDESQDGRPKKMRFQNFVLIKKGCDDSVESPPPEPKKPRQRRQPNFVLVRKGCDNPNDYQEPEPKKLREDVFITIRRCFVNLVKKGACPLSLFDEVLFRDVIDLIPMTRGEKDRISSEYIQTLIQNDTGCCLDQDTDVDNTIDKSAEATDDTNILEDAILIKGELETVLCTCGKASDSSMTSHSVDCASTEQTFMKFFDVSLDSATCHICNGTVAWTDRDTLKQHLQTEHPDAEYIDEDDEDNSVTTDQDSPNEIGIEEVFLEENLSGYNDSPMKCSKKRRKKSKLPLLFSGPMTREEIEASLQRLKSLDNFGPYVVSLLKSIPKDKCIRFQIEMVDRLLQEQAAAA